MSRQAISTRLYADFASLEADFGPTLRAITPPEVFQTFSWFQLIAETLHDDIADLLLLLAFEDDAPDCVTLLPLIVAKQLPPVSRQHWLQSLANYYSVLYGPLSSVADEQLADHLAALLKHLRHVRATSVIDLQPMPAEHNWLSPLITAARKAGFFTDTYFRFGNWYLPNIWDNYASYLQDRADKVKGSLLRAEKRIKRPDMACTITVYRGNEGDFENAVIEFDRVYRNSWRNPEPYPDFAANLCQLAAQEGWLRLGVLRLGKDAAAVQLWLTAQGKSNIYKIAYDEKFSKLSPGNVLTAAMIRHALEVDHVEEIDYLTGDEPYKRNWMSQRRERIGLLMFNPLTRDGLLSAMKHFGGKLIRKIQHAMPTKAKQVQANT